MDNCSKNNSYEKLSEMYSENNKVKIVKSDENKGFGEGNNLGVLQSKYENILLLNPDIIVLEDSIDKMFKKLISDSEIGVIGCKLLNDDLTLQYSCRKFIDFHKFIIARTPLGKLFKKKLIEEINDSYLMKDYDHKEEANVDWLMGSCLMLKKEVFNSVGGFTKDFFMYFEDVDLCYKIHKIGKKVLYYPYVSMIHKHEQESKKHINKLSFYHMKSMFIFYKKYIFNKIK